MAGISSYFVLIILIANDWTLILAIFSLSSIEGMFSIPNLSLGVPMHAIALMRVGAWCKSLWDAKEVIETIIPTKVRRCE